MRAKEMLAKEMLAKEMLAGKCVRVCEEVTAAAKRYGQ